MRRLAFVFTLAGTLLGLSTAFTQAHATLLRTWVSGKGVDTNPCSLAAPCRTFAYAITQTSPGGEIDVLDPAGYGAITITKAVSIVNDGVGVAGVQAAANGIAITINAGPHDIVHLRGLAIEGAGVAQSGIQFNSGASIDIVNCVVRHFSASGIRLMPSTTSKFAITDTFSSDNGSNGILIAPQGSANLVGVINGVTTNNNHIGGLYISGLGTTGTVLNATVVDSVTANNGFAGYQTVSNNGFVSPSLMLRDVTISNNGQYGIVSQNGVIRVAQSIAHGIFKFDASDVIYSYGDNDIVDGSFSSLTSINMQ
jgi:hypothetical protein